MKKLQIILLNKYYEKLKDIRNNIEKELPVDMKVKRYEEFPLLKMVSTILNCGDTYYPVLVELDSFIQEINKDIEFLNKTKKENANE